MHTVLICFKLRQKHKLVVKANSNKASKEQLQVLKKMIRVLMEAISINKVNNTQGKL
jgi:hypothetical protein